MRMLMLVGATFLRTWNTLCIAGLLLTTPSKTKSCEAGVFFGCWQNWGLGWAALVGGALTILLGLSLAYGEARSGKAVA